MSLPAWAQERLEAEASMGDFEGSPAERVGFTISTIGAILAICAGLALSIAFTAAMYIFVAKMLGMIP